MQQLATTDRSFQFGDGLFTTIRVQQGQLQLWPYHWQRFAASLQRLQFPSVDPDWLYQTAISHISAPDQVMKIIISRGQSGRGYSPKGCSAVSCYFITSPLPDYQQQQQQGIELQLAELKLARQPLLAGMKHTSRLETVLVKAEMERRAVEDVLLCDHDGFVIEASAGNIFFFKQQQWHTPKLDQAGIAGVMRHRVLKELTITPAAYTLAAIEDCEAMFVCNALMGVVPVRQYGERPLALNASLAIQQRVHGSLSTSLSVDSEPHPFNYFSFDASDQDRGSSESVKQISHAVLAQQTVREL